MSKPREPGPLPACPVCGQPAEQLAGTPWPPPHGTTVVKPCWHKVDATVTTDGDYILDAAT